MQTETCDSLTTHSIKPFAVIYRGRSIYANDATAGKLTRYLLHNPKNERVVFLGAHGTAFPEDLEKSIDQMIWRAEKSKSQKPLYFTALSPDLDVDKTLTDEEWEQIRYIQAKHLGLEGQPYAWVEHEKIGDNGQPRIHRHVVYQRFDTENDAMISDEYDRRKNAMARAEVEEKLGHERTFQRWTLEEIQARELAATAELNKEGQKVEAEKLKKRETMKLFLENAAEIETKQELALVKKSMAELLAEKYAQQHQNGQDQGISM